MISGMLVSTNLSQLLDRTARLSIKMPGGLIAAGVTYGTAKMDSTWAWRLPSGLQGVFSLVCIAILPFLPESPRWLVHKGRLDEALDVVAITYADGDATHPVALASFREIVDTLNWEKEAGETMSFIQMAKTPSSRKRTLLAVSVSVFVMLSGTINPHSW